MRELQNWQKAEYRLPGRLPPDALHALIGIHTSIPRYKIKVGGKPLLQWVVEWLKANGVTNIVMGVAHQNGIHGIEFEFLQMRQPVKSFRAGMHPGIEPGV